MTEQEAIHLATDYAQKHRYPIGPIVYTKRTSWKFRIEDNSSTDMWLVEFINKYHPAPDYDPGTLLFLVNVTTQEVKFDLVP